MIEMIIVPDGWPCTLEACRPGFFVFDNRLCFKSEYTNDNGHLEAFCESGEAFWGGAKTHQERDALRVHPVIYKWQEVEE